MTKHLTAMLAALVVTAGAAAQSVTVMMKDGSSKKFAADRIKEMTFQTTTPAPPAIELTTVDVDYYSSSYVVLTLGDTSGDNKFMFDLYFPSTKYLPQGVYTVGATEGHYIDKAGSNTSFTAEGTKKEIASGTVSISNEGEIYTFDVAVKLADGTDVAGKYVGKINKYSQYHTIELSAMTYHFNAQPKGQFFVKGNDSSWNNEVAVYFKADPDATTLPAGEYTFSEDLTPGTFTPQSYFTIPNPQGEQKAAAGSKIVVTAEGVKAEIVTTDGLHLTYNFTGTISGTPEFEQPQAEHFDFGTADFDYCTKTESGLTLTDATANAKVTLNIHYAKETYYLLPGTYPIASSGDMYIANSDTRWTNFTKDNNSQGISGGSMTVSNDGNNYTISVALTLADGTDIEGSYTGTLPKYYPNHTVELSAMTYHFNAQPKGQFFVKGNDSSWDNELAVYFKADPDATTLPAGEYTFSEDLTPGTFTPQSYFTLPSPVGEQKAAAGSKIVVTADGMKIEIITTTGLKVTYNFTGTISGTPEFE